MAKVPALKHQLTLTIGSYKGGGGKSDHASNLAVGFQRLGYKVALIDADPIMDTTINWGGDRATYVETNPKKGVKDVMTVKVKGKVRKAITDLSESYDVIIVDTAGQTSKEFNEAAANSDMVLTPVEASAEATDTLGSFFELIDIARGFNPDLLLMAVVSRIPPGSRARYDDTRAVCLDAQQAFTSEDDQDEFQLTVADTCITNRVAHPDSKAQGLGVQEYKDPIARDEMDRLTEELIRFYNKESE